MKYLILLHWFWHLTRQSVQESSHSPELNDTSQGTQLILQSSFDTKGVVTEDQLSQLVSYQASLCSLSRAEWVSQHPAHSWEASGSSQLSPESYGPAGSQSLTRDYLQWCIFNSPHDPTFAILLQSSRFQEANQRVFHILNIYRTDISLVCCSIWYLGTRWWEMESIKKKFQGALIQIWGDTSFVKLVTRLWFVKDWKLYKKHQIWKSPHSLECMCHTWLGGRRTSPSICS